LLFFTILRVDHVVTAQLNRIKLIISQMNFMQDVFLCFLQKN